MAPSCCAEAAEAEAAAERAELYVENSVLLKWCAARYLFPTPCNVKTFISQYTLNIV